MDELLTVEEVARYCRVHKATIRRHIASGRLRSVRIGRAVRVRKDDLEAYVDPAVAERRRRSGIDFSKLPPLELTGELKPFTLDDPFWEFVGKFDAPGSEWVSGDKHRALADAYTPKP
ncbi:MAG: helix-turn-helix domain-containing protein [Dehalococcoidia bacterium]